MPDPMTEMKIEIIRAKRKIKDAAEAFPMEYGKFGRILNGFESAVPGRFFLRMREILTIWNDSQKLIEEQIRSSRPVLKAAPRGKAAEERGIQHTTRQC